MEYKKPLAIIRKIVRNAKGRAVRAISEEVYDTTQLQSATKKDADGFELVSVKVEEGIPHFRKERLDASE